MTTLNRSAQRFARTLDDVRRAHATSLDEERLQRVSESVARARDADRRMRELCGR
jgi:hypothetical protein